MDDEMKRVLTGLFVLIGMLVLLFLVMNEIGCMPAQPAAYSAELVACNQTAFSLCESVACENKVRAAYARPARVMPVECGDGGVR